MDETLHVLISVFGGLLICSIVFLSPPLPVHQTINAIYFYGEGCSHCETVNPLIARLEAKYPELNIQRLEIFKNATNQDLLIRMNRQYNVSNLGVPTIYIGKTVMVGEVEIQTGFESSILAEKH